MILNVYKPRGWTSTDVVRKIKYISGSKKVGHGGTLDPFAEGVLIIGTNKDTKTLTSITAMDKSYEAELILGASTDTLDHTGKIIEKKSIPSLTKNDIKNVFKKMIGNSIQTPPLFSAKKVNGVRSYKLARQGKKVIHKPVKIHINSLDLLDFDKDTIRFSVSCSKGTYIRVLGSDIAKMLNTAGYLKKLIRTAIGEFCFKQSKHIAELENKWKYIET
tara:strand:+ start:658 stop:1311 length:654 start_codon:yes stop_codon:yes gene_type:complete